MLSRNLVSGCLLFAIVAGPVGCSDDSADTFAPSAPGPPLIALESPIGGTCVVLNNDADWTMRAKIRVENWTLRPPESCGILAQCGFAVFFVDDQLVAESSSIVTDLPFRALPSPTGSHRVTVELHDDAGPAMDAEGEPLRAEITVQVAAPDQTSCQ